MKNSSIAALALGISSLACFPSAAFARDAVIDPVPDISRARCAFRTSAPDQHVVVKGDTLWGISAIFLDHAWCWPRVWNLNKEQIRNPHWIYPGQIVYFDRVNGRLSLRAPNGAPLAGETILHPQIREEALGAKAISTIPSNLIEPFLSRPLVIEAGALDTDPRVVGGPPGSINFGRGNRVYVRGAMDQQVLNYQLFRPGDALKDPDSGTILGYEARYLGTARLIEHPQAGSDVATLQLTSSVEEISVGDRLLPVEPAPIQNYVPHPPVAPVNARLLSIYGGVKSAGQNYIVSINAGRAQGVDVGTVLELYRDGGIIKDRTANNEPVRLPDEQYGELLIFRVFDNVSYGLIMQVRDVATVGDFARSPR